MATTLLCRFCLSEVDARHASGLFAIQGELEDFPSCLGQIFLVAVAKNDGLPVYASICSSIHQSFLASNLTEGMQYGLVEHNFFPELTSVMCGNSSDPVMYDCTTQRCVYSSFQVPQKDLGSRACGNSVYQALPLKLTTTCEVRFT